MISAREWARLWETGVVRRSWDEEEEAGEEAKPADVLLEEAPAAAPLAAAPAAAAAAAVAVTPGIASTISSDKIMSAKV